MISSTASRPQNTAPDDASWWRGAVIYQIYPRSFADANGDGVGDLPGITARLEYVASLGVDAIWISPFLTSPMKDYGYDVADYRDVDPIFGTLADFDALLAQAHALGLKVLIDLVLAHTSDAHAWFDESRRSRSNPKANWYVWADPKPDGTPPNNWQSVFGGPGWTWDAHRAQYYMHNFLREQPQLNVHLPDVQAALLDVARFWLERGVDGFRLDAINYAMHDPALTDNPPLPAGEGARTRPFDFQRHVHNQSQPEIPTFLARMRALTDAYGGAFMVGEIGGEWAATEMKSYTHGEAHLHSAYSFAFLSAPALTKAHVRETLGQWSGAADEGWPSWAFSNHDAPRAASRWPCTPPALALCLLMSLRGNIFLYQGEELGLPQAAVPFDRLRDPEAIANWPLTQGRDGARTPMPWQRDAPQGGFSATEPWLPIDPRHVANAVDVQEGDPASLLALTRTLIAMRHAHRALRVGTLTMLATDNDVLGFERRAGDERLLCLFNLGDVPVDLAGYPMSKIVIAVGQSAEEQRVIAPKVGIVAAIPAPG